MLAKSLQNISLVFFGLLLASAIVEGYLRIVAYYPTVLIPPYLFDNHPTTGWTLRPNFTETVDTPEGPVTYSINTQGIRAPYDYSKTRSPTLQRVFIIGDSYTFGTGVNEEYTFPRLLNDRMKSEHLLVEVINLGVPGFGTIHSYERLLGSSNLLGVPDTVIYMFCPNDPVDNIGPKREVVNGIRIDSDRGNKLLLSYIAKAYHKIRFLALLLDFYYSHFVNARKLKGQELNRQAVNVKYREDFIATEKYLSKMISWADENKVNFLVVTTSHSEYSEPLKEMLFKMGIPIIEASDIFPKSNINNEPILLFDDHWNKHGHKLIAKGMEEFFFSSQRP